MRIHRVSGLVLIVAAGLGLGACGECSTKGTAGSGSKSADGGTNGTGGAGAVVQLTEANFQTEVLSSAQPVLVDFWAVWCGPCKMVAPTVDAVAGEYAGRVKVGKVDVDANSKLAKDYEIEAIPALIVYKNGKVVKKMVGLQSKETIVAALDSVLK